MYSFHCRAVRPPAVADPATGTDRLAVVLIPAESAGIERVPFWQTTALAGAESDQVTLTEVFVPEALIFYPHDGESMDPIQARGFVWFELLISASYLGTATNLAERRHPRPGLPPARPRRRSGPIARYLAGGPLIL